MTISTRPAVRLLVMLHLHYFMDFYRMLLDLKMPVYTFTHFVCRVLFGQPDDPHIHRTSQRYVATNRDWFHVVLTFRGPEDCLGFNLYFDGGEELELEWAVQDGAPGPTSETAATGRILLGAVEADDTNSYHGGLEIDEILMWNKVLTRGQVRQLYGSYERSRLYNTISRSCSSRGLGPPRNDWMPNF